jgi:hypothetical protein
MMRRLYVRACAGLDGLVIDRWFNGWLDLHIKTRRVFMGTCLTAGSYCYLVCFGVLSNSIIAKIMCFSE